MTLETIPIGIATNLATDLLKWGGKRISDSTKFGAKVKAVSGLLDESFEGEITEIIREAYELYFRRFPERRFLVFYNFFSSDSITKAIFAFIFDFEQINYELLEITLDKNMGNDFILRKILTKDGISIRQLIEDFMECYYVRERARIGVSSWVLIRTIKESEQRIIEQLEKAIKLRNASKHEASSIKLWIDLPEKNDYRFPKYLIIADENYEPSGIVFAVSVTFQNDTEINQYVIGWTIEVASLKLELTQLSFKSTYRAYPSGMKRVRGSTKGRLHIPSKSMLDNILLRFENKMEMKEWVNSQNFQPINVLLTAHLSTSDSIVCSGQLHYAI